MRIYCPDLPSAGNVPLSAEEAEHAVRVFRLKKGDQCELFDGKGNWASATFVAAQKKSAVVEVVQYHRCIENESAQIIVGIGLPRGDRQRNVVERATELGVDTLVPLNCEFGIAIATDNSIERAKRTVIESCKQSRRNQLMDIVSPQDFSAWIREESKNNPDSSLRLICHPRLDNVVGMRDISNLQAHFIKAEFGRVVLAVGPEGGFSDSEVQLAIEHGWKVLDLGQLILRVETALCAAVTVARTICAK